MENKMASVSPSASPLVSTSSGLWLFTPESLENTPSRRDGVDAATEQRYRREGMQLIRTMANNFSL